MHINGIIDATSSHKTNSCIVLKTIAQNLFYLQYRDLGRDMTCPVFGATQHEWVGVSIAMTTAVTQVTVCWDPVLKGGLSCEIPTAYTRLVSPEQMVLMLCWLR